MDIVEQFIGGKLRSSPNTAERFPIFNPAMGIKIADVLFATTEEINEAITVAKQSFSSWKEIPPIKRARILFKFKHLLEENIELLATQLTTEHGKVLEDARGEVLRAIELVEYLCGIPTLLKGSYSEEVSVGIDCYTIRQPLGVCVGITPFNFPVMISCWMFVSAIACGNTFILKPSEKDPSATLLLAQLMQKAGLPDGVLNIVHGKKSAVDQLITHADVRAVSSVGSSSVSEYIYQTAIHHGKRAHTFGGAKNHCVVMPDCDLNLACEAIVNAAFGSAGERCMALAAAVIVGEGLAENLIQKLKEKIAALKIGPGLEKTSDIGPLISRDHWQRVKNYIDSGVEEGAELVIDGRNFSLDQGFFMAPSVFDYVKENMKIYQEEIFGPVLVILRVKTLAQAIELINRHSYANGTAIFTQSGGIARQFAHQIEVGMVGVNVPIPVPVAFHTFGGWRNSSFGQLQMHNKESIEFYTRPKSVSLRWPSQNEVPDGYHMPTH